MLRLRKSLLLQNKMWQDYIEKLQKEKEKSSSGYDTDKISIHCRYCQSFFCKASELRKRESHYICIAEDFPTTRTFFKETDKPKEFRSDSHIGK